MSEASPFKLDAALICFFCPDLGRVLARLLAKCPQPEYNSLCFL